MPEIEKEESQEQLAGWEDLSSTDDGSRDMGDYDSEPEAAEEQKQPAGTPTGTAPEPQRETAEPTGQAAETQEITEETPPETVYTLPGGKKVTQAELVADPDLLAKLVTHSNQVSDAQRIAKERKDRLDELEAENRKLLDQYTAWEMQQKLAVQQPPQAAAPRRPEPKVLEGIYATHLDKLVADGRLSEDQRSEFGNVLSEYMFDQQNTHNLITEITSQGMQRIDAIEARLNGEVVPEIQRRQQHDSVALEQSVWQGVASRPGYEALADQETWERLKSFITEKVNASPKDQEGRPTFDPQFDVDSMAQMYDAMTGAELRATLAALKATRTAEDKQSTAMAGGETAARAARPPQKQPSPLTPEQEAMDFRDPTMATG